MTSGSKIEWDKHNKPLFCPCFENMSSSSSSRFRSGRNVAQCGVGGGHNHPLVCLCGFDVVGQTSWIAANPGRRFVTCPIRGVNKCKFFYWCDFEVCDRAKTIIPGLLEKINTLKSSLATEKKRLKK
ncbi:hypothetical protein ABFS82_01G101700 [Erythranthe guttata]